jgi:hypothetical protein
MQTTAELPPLHGGDGSRAFPEQPRRVVRAVADVSFLSREGVLTGLETKMPYETMAGISRAVRIPRVVRTSEPETDRFTLLQKWEGVVLEADEETFTARLSDSHGELPPQQATFSRSEVSPEEETQIAVGAPLVWTIGYRHIGATRHRDSTIYFRRLPPWSAEEINTARSKAEETSAAIGWK